MHAAMLLVVLMTALAARGVRSREVDGDRKVGMKIAQCRATCLARFARNGTTPSEPHHLECEKELDCNMCWQVCDLLHSNFYIWGPMCGSEDICFPGCKVACAFHQTGSSGLPEQRGRFSQPPQLGNDVTGDAVRISWLRPRDLEDRPMEGALVYLILLEDLLTGSWKETPQTIFLNASLSRSELKQSSKLKLIAVGPAGRAAESVLPVNLESEGVLNDAGEHRLMREPWTPRLLNLRWSEGSVEATITWGSDVSSWRSPTSFVSDGFSTKFEVTWRLVDASEDVMGRVYTSRDVASLKLWPKATYSVNVRRYGASEKPEATSQALIIDTHGLEPEPQSLVEECPGCVRLEVVAGCAAALVLVLLVCILALIFSKLNRSRRQQGRRHSSIVKGLPEKAARRLHMDAIKPTPRLDLPGIHCTGLPAPMHVHQSIQPSGPVSPVGESREDLLDDNHSQSNYFVFDLNSVPCKAPRV